MKMEHQTKMFTTMIPPSYLLDGATQPLGIIRRQHPPQLSSLPIDYLGHAWPYKAHGNPAQVYKGKQQELVISVILISEIVLELSPDQGFWMDHACVNGIPSDCLTSFQIRDLFIVTKLLAETNESNDPKLTENENSSYKTDATEKSGLIYENSLCDKNNLAETNESNDPKLTENENSSYKSDAILTVLPFDTEKSGLIYENSLCDKNNVTSGRRGFNSTTGSLFEDTKCDSTTNLLSHQSQHILPTNFTHHSRRNYKSSVWTFLFLFLLCFPSLAAAPREVSVKKCCPDGKVLDGPATCVTFSGATPPFISTLRGLDPSKSNYRDHPVDMRLVPTGDSPSLPGSPDELKLYKLEQGTAWLTVGGNLITSEFEAEFPHGEICVDRTVGGERAAVMKDPCKDKLCLTLCCPHGQALVDDPTVEATIDENVPKICGNFDWDWNVKFWSESNNGETTASRNDDFVLREDVKHSGSFSCPSNCGGKKGTLGFADSTYSQIRLYSNGTLSGKLGDITHLIQNKRFCVAYGDPPNYDYGEVDSGMRVTYMVCSQPKCPPSEDGVPDAKCQTQSAKRRRSARRGVPDAKCPPSEDGVPDAIADKSVSHASGNFIVLVILVVAVIMHGG